MGAVAQPELWPIWTVVGAASTLFPFLLMPVYVIFISRDRPGLEPRPTGPRVVRNRVRAAPRAGQRDLGDAGRRRRLPDPVGIPGPQVGRPRCARPELRPGPRRQAQPRRLRLVHDPRLGAELDHARASTRSSPAAPGRTWSRTRRTSAGCRSSARSGSSSRSFCTGSPGSGPIYNALSGGSAGAGLPEQLGCHLRLDRFRHRSRLVRHPVMAQPAARHRDELDVQDAASRLT